MEIKKIGCMNKEYNLNYIPIPRDFGKKGDFVRIVIVNEKELKVTIID